MAKALSLDGGSENWVMLNTTVADAELTDYYPAWYWVRGKGSDWYLPAREELVLIESEASALNKNLDVLRTRGYKVTNQGTVNYWSSSIRGSMTSIYNNTAATIWVSHTESLPCYENNYTRAVKKF